MLGVDASMQGYLTLLASEPGTTFSYEIGIDWAGHLVCRISCLDLEEYFKGNIWNPCGIQSISFFPPADHVKIMTMTTRMPT